MQEILEIKINGRKWNIERIDNSDSELLDETDCGATCYLDSKIDISSRMNDSLARDTINHELAHAFLFTYGFNQMTKFTEENVCDFFGAFGSELIALANAICESWGIE